MRKSIPGNASLNLPIRETSHFDAKFGETLTVRMPASRVKPRAKPVEGIADEKLAGPPRLGEEQSLTTPQEEFETQSFLQRLDLMTDRALGHIQFCSTLGEAEVTCGRLEGT